MRATLAQLLLAALIASSGSDSQDAYGDKSGSFSQDDFSYDDLIYGSYSYEVAPEEGNSEVERINDHEYDDPVHEILYEDPIYSPPLREEESTLGEVSSNIDEPICGSTCRYGGGAFVPGYQYSYFYEGHVSTWAEDYPKSPSTMGVDAIVTLRANTPCDLRMTVSDMRVEDAIPEDSQWLRDAVQKHDLHFSYQNGRIEHLCPDEEEDAIATNFKRGILSALQTSVGNLHQQRDLIVQESDVLGECETRYQTRSEGDGLVVTKSKENCRADAHFPYVPHSPYASSDFEARLPFLRSNQSCRLVQEDGVWSRVECDQTVGVDGVASLRPRSLARVAVSSALRLNSPPGRASGRFSQGGRLQKKVSLRMDLEGSLLSAEARRDHDSSTILDQIADTLEDLQISMRQGSGLEEQRPLSFANLVTLLGRLKQEEDMVDVWETYGNEEGYRELVRDALLVCSSEACAHMITRLALDDHPALPPTTLATWLAGLHFRTHTDLLTISHIMELSQNKPDFSGQALMAASSLVHTVCQQEPHNCFANAQPFLEYVRGEVGSSCGFGETQERRQHIKLVLRALGNAGALPEPHFPEKCYKNKILMPELRIAALQVNRRIGCSHSDAPWKILEDVDDEVEVRQAAFLALVPCATHTPDFFTRIKELLEKEEVNQVGSYIWTHVKNLAEQHGASEQSHQLAKLATLHTLNHKFNTNGFRSSRNYHYGHYSEVMNLGGSMDGDVIFTPDSYLPRQAALNLTLDLMDKSFNILEFGGSFKGLEEYIEKFFSKGGYFENDKIQNALESLRPKRDIHHEKIEDFKMLYEEARTRNELIEPEEEEEAKASVYLRVFGSEVLYLENALKSNPLQFLQQLVQEFSSPKSFQVVDQEFLSPTLLGFPLRLRLNATGSVTFNREGTFLMTGANSVQLEGKISPSIAVALDETLMVDGYISSSGIRRRTTQTTHADFGLKFALENGQMVDFQFDIPGTDLAKMSSSVRVMAYKNILKNWEEMKTDLSPIRQQSCSSNTLSKLVGLQACSTSSYCTYYVAEGDIVGEPCDKMLQIAKTDTFESYIFSFRKIENEIEVFFDTPGSSIERKINFRVILTPDGAEGSFVIPGKSIHGQYEISPVSKRISFQYLENSELQGEFEVSLQTVEGENTAKFTPRLLLSFKNVVDINVDGTLEVGAEIFRLEGNFMSSLQTEPGGFSASWSHRAGQHNVESKLILGPVFWSTSGTLFISQEDLMLEGICNYGSGTVQPHTLAVKLNSTQMVEQGEKVLQGYLSIEASQAEANIDLDYEYRPGLVQANTNITLHDTQASSRLLVKRISDGEKRDFEVTVSFVSPQLDVNYLGQFIYKVSDDAFQAEAEIVLGTWLQSKMSLTYMLQYNPLHLLAGLHLQLNDFIIQAGYNIDLSVPDRTLVTMSSTVGGAAAGFHLEADYNHSQPLNASLEVFAGYNTLFARISHHTSSDLEWQHFSGETNLRWFDESYEVQHEALWSASEKQIKISRDVFFINATIKSSPSPRFQLLVNLGSEDSEPPSQIVIEKLEEQDYDFYQVLVTAGTNTLLYLTASNNKDQTFNGSLRLLESNAQVHGRYSQSNRSLLEGSAQVTITLPSGQSYTSDLSLSYFHDHLTQDIKVSHFYDGSITEGHLKMQHYDGWFRDDSQTFAFTLTTPFDQLQKFGIAFENHDDPALVDFVEVEWEEVKVRGEAKLSDPTHIEMKLLYEDGGTCDSHIHLYHHNDEKGSLTDASLALTSAHHPWTVQVFTTLDQSDQTESRATKLSFQSPLLVTPFRLNVIYNITGNHFDLNVEAGLEELISLSLSGKKYIQSGAEVFSGMLEFDTPWTEIMILNMTSSQSKGNFDISLDLKSAWDPINSVAVKFSTTYEFPNATKAHFYLSHDHLQVVMELALKLTDTGLSSHFQGSANTMRVISHFNSDWDENFIPVTSSGQLSVTNVYDHKLDLTLSHAKESDIFYTQIFGSWDNQTIIVDHKLDYKQPLEWLSVLQTTLPGQVGAVETELKLNAQPDVLSVNLDLSLMSPWTEDFSVKFALEMNESLNLFEIDSMKGDASFIKLALLSSGPFNWYQSDLSFEVSSIFSDNYDIKWKHNFVTESLVFVEVTQGSYFDGGDSDFYFKGTSTLTYNEGVYGQEFAEFDFSVTLNSPSPRLDFKSKVNIDAQFGGELEVKLDDHILSITSALFDGIVFRVRAGAPMTQYETELKYDEGIGNIPDLHFRFTQDKMDIFIFTSEFGPLYPVFHANLNVSILMDADQSVRNGQLSMIANMTSGFKGSFKLESDFEGFKNYWAELDADMNTGTRGGNIDGHLDGIVHISDWHYKFQLFGSFDSYSRFDLRYMKKYELHYGEQLIDRKQVDLLIKSVRSEWFGGLTVKVGPENPDWSFTIDFDPREEEFKISVSPGTSEKYGLSAHIDGNGFSIDAYTIGEEGLRFQILKGDINWNIRKRKKQFILNMNSDYAAFRKVTGQIVIQQKRGLAANAKFRINQENFTGSLRYISQGAQNSGKIILKAENDIYVDFKVDTNINFSLARDRYESDLVFDLNDQKGWFTANLKGSLPESNLQLKLPYEGYENIELLVKTNFEENWGVKVTMKTPKFCGSIDTMLDRYYRKFSLNANIQAECIGEEIVKFNFSYVNMNESIQIASDCYIQDYGSVYQVEVITKRVSHHIDFKMECKVYPHYSLGVAYNNSWHRDNNSFTLQVYDIHNDKTYFLYKLSILPSNANVVFELNDGQLVSLQFESEFGDGHLLVDVIYSHLVIGYPLNVKVAAESSIKETSGSIELLITTDLAFDHVDLFIAYDRKEKDEGTFTLSTTLGDAEGKITYFKDKEDSHSVRADMTSTLHSFREYHIELDSESDDYRIEIVGVGDETQYRIRYSVVREDNETVATLDLKTPFMDYENFNFGIVYPHSGNIENSYEAYGNMVLHGNLYGIDITHNHQESWRSQKTEIVFITPTEVVGNVSASVMYDESGEAEFQLGTFQGSVGLSATWQHLEKSFVFGLNPDLTLFHFGKYVFHIDVPFTYSRDGEIRFERHQTDFDFISRVVARGSFTHANLSFVVLKSDPVPQNVIYALSYELEDSLRMFGQFEVWEASAVVRFEGKEIPVASGTFNISTNIEGYEGIEGLWNVKREDQEYLAVINLDVENWESVALRASFNIQPDGVSAPWDKTKLDVLFDSPFTLTHHLQAECQFSIFKIAALYHHGLDTFQVNFSSEFKQMEGTLSLNANIPLRGISTWDLNFSYVLRETYSINLIAAIEETTLRAGLELASDGAAGSVTLSLTSPFFRPMKATLNWSFNENTILLEATYDFGKYSGGLKMNIENTNTAKKLEVLLRTPIEMVSNFDFIVNYSNTESNQMHITSDITFNDQIYKIKFTYMNNRSNFDIDLSGFMDAFGISGSVQITFRKANDVYEAIMSSDINYYKPLDFFIILDTEHIESSVKYGTANVLVVNLNFSHMNIQYILKDHSFLNVTANLIPADNGYLFELILYSSETKPLTLNFSYSDTEGHEGNAHLTIGESEYNLRGALYSRKKNSAFEFQLDSPEDLKAPIRVNAVFDFKDFLKGRMNSVMDLASISFEWEEMFHLNVTGMRNRNHAKVNVEMSTPLKFLPKLQLGCDVEFSMKKSSKIDLMFTAFADWSERMTLTGFFQLLNEKMDMNVAVTSPFPGYKKLSASFKFNSGNIEATLLFNNDEWNILCSYELSPILSLSLAAKTPVEGYEALSLFTSAGMQEGLFKAETALSWLNTTAVRIQIQAEMWRLSFHVNTPWKTAEKVSFVTSLRTESEELMLTIAFQWNEKKTEMTLIYSPEQFHFASKHEENGVVIGLVWVEYSLNEQEFKFEVEIKTPFKSLASLKVVLRLGAQDNYFIAKMNVNDRGYIIEGMYSVIGGTFYIDIPALGEFTWTLEARNMWMAMETQASFIYPQLTAPLTATLAYDIQVDKAANLDIKFDAPELRLESLNFSTTAIFGERLQFVDASSTLFVKVRNEETTKHEVNITSSVIVDQVALTLDLESDFVVPYSIKGKIPLFNFFIEKGFLEFVLMERGEQIYSLFYETSLLEKRSSRRLAELAGPEWVAGVQVIANGEILNISFSYPEPASNHNILLKWSQDFSLEDFTIGAAFDLPYFDEGKFKIDLDFGLKENSTYVLDSVLYYGSKNIELRGIFQYTDDLYQIKGDLQVQSNWIGMHSMEAIIHWPRDITAEVKLNSLDEEHSLSLQIDRIDYAISLKCNSSYLPHKDIMIKGKISRNYDPFFIQFEGKFDDDKHNDNIFIEFLSEGFQNTTFYITIGDWSPDIRISGVTKFHDGELLIDTLVRIRQLDFESSFRLRMKDVNEMGDAEAKALHYLLDIIHLKFNDTKFWLNDFQINFDHKDYYSRVQFDFESERVYCLIKTPMEDFRYLKVSTYRRTSEDKRHFGILFVGRYDESITLEVESIADSVMGRSLLGFLRTPFKGYETFLVQTPKFDDGDSSFTVMLEYPGCKTGIVWRYPRRGSFQFSLYLPFEDYDVFSLQYGFQEEHFRYVIGITVRVSKVGVTLTTRFYFDQFGFKAEAVVRVNEYAMKAELAVFYRARRNYKVRVHFEFSPKDLLGIRSFTNEFSFVNDEMISFEARTNREELLKVHLAWGPDKVFAITTPKRYPGYLLLNLESTKDADDYELQLGLSFKDSPWDVYGFHVHQEILEAGRHLSLSGVASEIQFSVEGTFSVNSMHLNQSLVFELNRKRMGYKVLLQRKPEFFNNLYIVETNLIIPTRSVLFKTNVLSNSWKLDMLSSFAWNEYDPEMTPLSLKLHYDDHSLFGDERHYMKAVFSHPDIKDVILQGNITQIVDSPLYGLAELSQKDSSERNIVMTLDVQPITDSEERIINVSISQPFSGFSLSMDAQVMRSVFCKGDYTFKYLSPTEKSLETLKIVTNVDTTDHGYDFDADIYTSQSNWGYSYRGNVQSWDHSAVFDIQGISREFGEFWKFSTMVKKHLPQLLVSLDIGQEGEEAYERGRMRIGIQNPVEIGAILDHQRFGEWIQDYGVGLKLTSSDVLQFFLEFDPSLDYRDEAFWAHLTSPADKILDAWWRDLSVTASSVKRWILMETPVITNVLVDRQTLQAVWEREISNYNLFIGEVSAAISDSNEGVISARVQQLLVNARRFIMNMYSNLESFLLELRWKFDLHQVEWQTLQVKITALQNQLSVWWADITTEMIPALNDTMYHVVRTMNLARGAFMDFVTVFHRVLQPYQERVIQAFTRYGLELDDVLYRQCWFQIYHKFRQMLASILESVDNDIRILREFLQPEAYSSIFSEMRDSAEVWLLEAKTIFQDGMAQLGEALQESPMLQALHQAYQKILNIFSTLVLTVVNDIMEHGVLAIGPYATAATEEVFRLWGESIEVLERFSSDNIIFSYVNAASGNVYEQILLKWQSWKEEERQTLESFEKALLSFTDAVNKLLISNNYFMEESFLYEPDVYGKIIYNQHLPVPWTSFVESPQWYRLTNIFHKESPLVAAQRVLAGGMDSIASGWEALHLPGAFTPPFPSTATITGQHITTFDLRHYQFLGPCSYLLTMDIVGGDFSVIGVYHVEAGVIGLESLIVSGRSTNVTIHVNGTIDATEADAEIYAGSDHSGVKMGGLLVTCSRTARGCSITVSGKYFGRLVGLLGNFNHEPSDDFLGPDGKQVHYPADMASKWAVSPEPCYQANQATRLQDITAAKGVDECFHLFLQKASLFSSCFSIIDPQPYFWHCINDHNRHEYGDKMEYSVCNAAAAYQTQCKSQGINLPLLEQCQINIIMEAVPSSERTGSCQVADQTFPSGWSKTYRGETHGSADIALIIELANCNKDRDLQQFLRLVKVQLRKADIQDVRYALITVTGDDVAPASEFMNENDMSELLGTLVLQGPKAANGNAAAVISTAKHLEWRLGVSRSIVQMACRACSEGDAVLQALRENDAAFHLITKFKVTMEGPSPKKSIAMANKLLGFDKKFVYTPRDIKKFSGSAKLRAALQEPSESCMLAAQESGGSVFNINKWIPNKIELTKKFLRVLSQGITVKSAAPECQECRCTGGGSETALMCRKCSVGFSAEEVQDSPVVPQAVIVKEDRNITKENLTIVSDIKKDFIVQFVDENAAFALLDDANGDADREDSQSEEESDPPYRSYGDDEDAAAEQYLNSYYGSYEDYEVEAGKQDAVYDYGNIDYYQDGADTYVF